MSASKARKPSARDVRALRLAAIEGGLILTLREDKPHRVYTTAARGIAVPNAGRLIKAGWLVPDKDDSLFGAMPQRWRVLRPVEDGQ
jgi:hypothetical protein